MSNTLWFLDTALDLIRKIEAVCPKFGCHVALTGGVLYKDGGRKDLDLLFYRIRQEDSIDVAGLFKALAELGVERITRGERWCIKATIGGRKLDCFFPEVDEGDYEDDDESDREDTTARAWERLAEDMDDPAVQS